VGNRILLPVYHPGALLYLGDVHASQGDTEFTGTAAETNATVRLRLEVLKGKKVPWMRVEKPGSVVALRAALPLEAAVETATVHLIDRLVSDYRFSVTDAYCLVSTSPCFDSSSCPVFGDGGGPSSRSSIRTPCRWMKRRRQ
jgi:acetamidase/formamidase